MKALKTIRFACLTLGLWLGVSGCNMDGPKGKDDKDADASAAGFSLSGSLCGTYAYFHGFAGDKEKDGRPIKLNVSLGICGKRDGVDWKALAVSHDDDEVGVKYGGVEGKSPIYLDTKRGVHVRRPDGQLIKIGTASASDIGAPVKLENGFSLQVLVEGEPFRLDQHSKSSPGKSLLVTTSRD